MRLPEKWLWLCLDLLLPCTVAQFQKLHGLTVNRAIGTQVDAALTISGKWSNLINGKSCQQMPLDTFKGSNTWRILGDRDYSGAPLVAISCKYLNKNELRAIENRPSGGVGED